MKRSLLAISVFLLCSFFAFAQHRSEQSAIQVAQEFLRNNGKTPQISIVPSQKIEALVCKRIPAARRVPAQSQSFYVVNDEANNRFVIVSADERLNTILGYSDKGCFEEKLMPDALLSIMNEYNRQYHYLLSLQDNTVKEVSAISQEVEVIKPMITTYWGQAEPFNAECPIDPDETNGTHCATGCLATAMAQVINYHKYPAKCKGNYQYKSDKHKFSCNMDFENYSINYDKLVDDLNNAKSDEKAEVAKLMHACGVSIAMDYCADGSGSKDYNIPYALIHFFGYNPNIVYRKRDYYTAEEWHKMIMDDLKAGRPVIYSGFDENGEGGHSFVLDGCDENGLYHVNLGATQDVYGYLWSGPGDGYYRLEALKPQFLGVGLGDYSYQQSMVCNISPTETGIHEDIFFAPGFNISPASLFTYSYSIIAQCYSSDTNRKSLNGEFFSGEIGIGLFDTDYNFLNSMYSEKVNCKSADAYIKLVEEITLNTSGMEDFKNYYIAPYAKSNYSDKPTIIRGKTIADVESDEYKNTVWIYYEAYGAFGLLVAEEKRVIGVDVESPRLANPSDRDGWFTLQGLRLDEKPNKPGVYLHQGRKVLIK